MVEPAQPPINIRIKNITKGKLPQLSNWAFTYPVPVRIEITLKKIDLRLNNFELSKIRYVDRIITDNNIIFNYYGGTLDIFINKKLMSSTPNIIPLSVDGAATCGSDNGIYGGIKNAVYFKNTIWVF